MFLTMNLSSTVKPRTPGEVRQETVDLTAAVGLFNQSTSRNMAYFCRPLASQSSASADASKIPGSHIDVVTLTAAPQDVPRGVGDIWAQSAHPKSPGFVHRKYLPEAQKPGQSAPKVYVPQSSQTPDSWKGETTQEFLKKTDEYIMKREKAEHRVSGHYSTPIRRQNTAPERESPECDITDWSPRPCACRETQQPAFLFSNVPVPPVAVPYPYLHPDFLPYLQLQPFLQRCMKEESLSPTVRERKFGSNSNSERDVCRVKPQPRRRKHLQSKPHGFYQKPHVKEDSSAGRPYPSSHGLHEEQHMDLRPWFAHSPMQGHPVMLSAHPRAMEISSFSNTIRQQHQISHILPPKKRSVGFTADQSGRSSPKTRKYCSLKNEAGVFERTGDAIKGKRTELHCMDYSQKQKNEIQWNRKKAASSKVSKSPQMLTPTSEKNGSATTSNLCWPTQDRELPPSRSLPSVLTHAGHFDVVDAETSAQTEIRDNIKVQRAREYVPQPEASGCSSGRKGDVSHHCQGPNSNGNLVTSRDSTCVGLRLAQESYQTKTWVPQRKRGQCEQSSDQNFTKEINPGKERHVIQPWAPALVNREKSDVINLTKWKDQELPWEISGCQTQNKNKWQDIHKKYRLSPFLDPNQICSEKEGSGEISGPSSQAVSDPRLHGVDETKYLTLDRGVIFQPKWHGIEAVFGTYINYMEENELEEMALQEQLKQSKALNEQLNQTAQCLRIQLQELEASKAQLVRDQRRQEAALSCLQKCFVFAV